jgi:hypothetical protein
MTNILVLIMTAATLAVAHPVRRMHYGIVVDGVVYPTGYPGPQPTDKPLKPVKYSPVTPFLQNVPHLDQRICGSMKFNTVYPNITMRANTNNHTFDTNLKYQLADIFSTYSPNPKIEILQGDTVLESYTLTDLTLLMNYNPWNTADDFVYFRFYDCMTNQQLIDSIFATSSTVHTTGMDPNQNNVFDYLEFRHVADNDESRSVVGCVGDIPCVVNWCNAGHTDAKTYIYYPTKQVCVYPKDTTMGTSGDLNLVVNSDT